MKWPEIQYSKLCHSKPFEKNYNAVKPSEVCEEFIVMQLCMLYIVQYFLIG
jgi:hypothetical protein